MRFTPLIPVRLAILALGANALTSCADPPSAPRAVVSDEVSAAKQSTTSSKMLFWELVEFGQPAQTYQVFSMSDDGTQVLQVSHLPGSGFNPSWAPDGKRILYSGWEAAGAALTLWVMSSDGTGVTHLTQSPYIDDYPVASGKDVLFIRNFSELASLKMDGMGVTILTTGVDSDAPSPNPKGRGVAFAKGGDIWILDQTTGALTNITNTQDVIESNPSFSPSGKQIAFRSIAFPAGGGVVGGIYIMNADGTAASQLTDHESDVLPRWSPNGKRIAFSSLREDPTDFDIFNMSADGTDIRNLTRTIGVGELLSAWTAY